MKPAFIEGLESALISTAMFAWPQYLTWFCWAMSLVVVVGTATKKLLQQLSKQSLKTININRKYFEQP